MEITLKKTDKLGRALTVSLVNGELEQETTNLLKQKAKTAKLSGFRKGHIPAHIIEKHYGAAARQEALQHLVNTSLSEALTEKELQPAMPPRVEDASIDKGEIRYTALFEVLPEIKLVSADKLRIDKPECEISEADVDSGLEQLRKHYRDLQPVTRPAIDGDVVGYEFTATLPDGQTIGPRTEQVELRAQTPENIREVLIGGVSGDERRLDMPADLPATGSDQAGERVTATCVLKIQSVQEPVLPELNDDFLNRLNVKGGMEELRKEVRNNMEQETTHRLRDQQWKMVCECLLKEHSRFPLPKTVVDAECEALKKNGMVEKEATTSAERKVREQLLLTEIVRQYDIKVPPAEVRQLVESAAMGYKDPTAFLTWHYADEKRLNSFRMLALRNRVMERLLEQAQLTPVAVTYTSLTSSENAA